MPASGQQDLASRTHPEMSRGAATSRPARGAQLIFTGQRDKWPAQASRKGPVHLCWWGREQGELSLWTDGCLVYCCYEASQGNVWEIDQPGEECSRSFHYVQGDWDLREGGRDLTGQMNNWVKCPGLANCQAHSRRAPDIYCMILPFMCAIRKTFLKKKKGYTCFTMSC